MAKKTIEISEETYKKIEPLVKNSKYDTIEEYVEYILDQVIKKSERKKENEKDYDDKLKNRLKSLGYMD